MYSVSTKVVYDSYSIPVFSTTDPAEEVHCIGEFTTWLSRHIHFDGGHE